MSHYRGGSDAHRRCSQSAVLNHGARRRLQTRVDHQPGPIQPFPESLPRASPVALENGPGATRLNEDGSRLPWLAGTVFPPGRLPPKPVDRCLRRVNEPDLSNGGSDAHGRLAC